MLWWLCPVYQIWTYSLLFCSPGGSGFGSFIYVTQPREWVIYCRSQTSTIGHMQSSCPDICPIGVWKHDELPISGFVRTTGNDKLAPGKSGVKNLVLHALSGNSHQLLFIIQLTAKGKKALQEVCHTSDQHTMWRFPGYEFIIQKNSLLVAQVSGVI